MFEIIFWAQSLDNKTQDPIKVGEKFLSNVVNRTERELSISEINDFWQNNKTVLKFSNNDVQFVLHKNSIAFKFPSQEKDEGGRKSPIIVFIKNISTEKEDWIDEIISKINLFCKEIERSISEQTIQLLTNGFKKWEKRKNRFSMFNLSNGGKKTKMSEIYLPQNPHDRKLIFILDSHDINVCSIKGIDVFDRTPGIFLLKYEKTTPENPILKDLWDRGLLSPGSVIVKSPFNHNKYYDFAEALEKVSLEKILNFSKFCSLLGAKEVIVREVKAYNIFQEFQLNIEKDSEENETISFISPTLASFFIESSANSDIFEKAQNKLKQKISLKDNYSGGEKTIVKAENFLRNSGLNNDDNCCNLLDIFKDEGNRLVSRELRMDLTNEIKEFYKIAGELRVPKFVKFKGSYKNNYSIFIGFKVSFEVKF